MTPLSALKYVTRNKLRVLPVFLVIALAVVAVSLTAVLTGSMIEASRVVWLKPYERYSLVLGMQGWLQPDVVGRLRGSPRVASLLPVVTASVRVHGIIGSEARPVLGLRPQDMGLFLRRVRLRLVAGRLPRAGEAAVALHRDIMKSKGIELGDYVGRDVDIDEYLLGRYRVVGVLAGPYPFGVASYDRMIGVPSTMAGQNVRALLVFPRRGQERRLEADLLRLDRGSVSVSTFSKEQRRFNREVANLDTLIWLLNFITVTALSLAVGLLNLIFVRQRMGEYGILAAIGYRRAFLLRRTFLEMTAVTLAAWGGGLAMSCGLLGLVARAIYEPKGIYLTGIDGRVMAYTAPIPALTLFFSLLMVFWILWRVDPVSIVERRD